MGAYLLFINVYTYYAYYSDKRSAVNNEACPAKPKRRSREAKLHLLEFVGGWPAALIAQKTLRHKCSKLAYQLRFWSIIILWELAALDFIFNGLLARTVYGLL